MLKPHCIIFLVSGSILHARVPVPGFIMYSPLQSMHGAWFLNAIRSSSTMHAARFAVISVTSKAREKEAARRWQHKEGGEKLLEQNENPPSTESTQRWTELHNAAQGKKEFGQWTIGPHRHKSWSLAMFQRFSTAAPQHRCYLKSISWPLHCGRACQTVSAAPVWSDLA